jgi:hypothetical protein
MTLGSSSSSPSTPTDRFLMIFRVVPGHAQITVKQEPPGSGQLPGGLVRVGRQTGAGSVTLDCSEMGPVTVHALEHCRRRCQVLASRVGGSIRRS